jgi:hypothetical protein
MPHFGVEAKLAALKLKLDAYEEAACEDAKKKKQAKEFSNKRQKSTGDDADDEEITVSKKSIENLMEKNQQQATEIQQLRQMLQNTHVSGAEGTQ